MRAQNLKGCVRMRIKEARKIEILLLLLTFAVLLFKGTVTASGTEAVSSELSKSTQEAVLDYYQHHQKEIAGYVQSEPANQNAEVSAESISFDLSFRKWIFDGNTEEIIESGFSGYKFDKSEIWIDVGYSTYLVFSDQNGLQFLEAVTVYENTPRVNVELLKERVQQEFGDETCHVYYALYKPFRLNIAVVTDSSGQEWVYSFFRNMESFGLESDTFIPSQQFLKAMDENLKMMNEAQEENTAGGTGNSPQKESGTNQTVWVVLPILLIAGGFAVFAAGKKTPKSGS